jgi:hypothetical protein
VLLNPVQQFFFSLCDTSTKPTAILPVTFDISHIALWYPQTYSLLYIITLEGHYGIMAVLNMHSERGAVMQDSLLEQTVLLPRSIFLEIRDRVNV